MAETKKTYLEALYDASPEELATGTKKIINSRCRRSIDSLCDSLEERLEDLKALRKKQLVRFAKGDYSIISSVVETGLSIAETSRSLMEAEDVRSKLLSTFDGNLEL